jgi:hypothetical protein
MLVVPGYGVDSPGTLGSRAHDYQGFRLEGCGRRGGSSVSTARFRSLWPGEMAQWLTAPSPFAPHNWASKGSHTISGPAL